jgi:hypothetical protein
LGGKVHAGSSDEGNENQGWCFHGKLVDVWLTLLPSALVEEGSLQFAGDLDVMVLLQFSTAVHSPIANARNFWMFWRWHYLKTAKLPRRLPPRKKPSANFRLARSRTSAAVSRKLSPASEPL